MKAIPIEQKLIQCGRANLLYRAGIAALNEHLGKCPMMEAGEYEPDTGYCPNQCTFPHCFIQGHDPEGNVHYRSDCDPHCSMAQNLSTEKHKAKLALSKARRVLLQHATRMAQA